MPRFAVLFAVHATTTLEVEAADRDEAARIAADEFVHPSLCHQCSDELNVDDVGEIVGVDELEDAPHA